MYNGDKFKSSTQTLVYAMYQLAKDIYSEDGTANTAIREAADRLIEQELRIRVLEYRIEDMLGEGAK